jgi:radical SAM superfamily enzyme YgiQ (UPF0313 family)
LAREVKKINPDCLIIFGGPQIPEDTNGFFEKYPYIDIIVHGEGEYTLKNILQVYLEDKNWLNVKGISTKDFRTNPQERINDLSDIPSPYLTNLIWDLVDKDCGVDWDCSWETNRGCPYQCTFCSSPTMWTTRYIMRDTKELVDEIEWLIKTYKANDFEFFDLTAIIKKNWIMEFCNELKKRDLNNITWQLPTGTRTEALDPEVMEAIYKAGCRAITFAPESGSERTLKAIKKRVRLDRLLKSVKAAVKIGHITRINLVIGFPHERVSDCLKTIFFGIYSVFRYGVSDVNIAVFAPYPGSELFEELKAKKKFKIDDDYFKKLMVQFDITKGDSYCEHVSGKVLVFLRILGFSLSYLTLYISRPLRIYKLFKNLFKKDFFANNLLEQRFYDMYVRYKIGKTTKKLISTKIVPS